MGASIERRLDSASWTAMKNFAASGGAVTIATGLTHPLDVVKVQLQLEGMGQRVRSTGMFRAATRSIHEAGLVSLYRGLIPALYRASSYGCLRLGLYEPIKRAIGTDGGGSYGVLLKKIAAGAIAGSVGTLLTNPMDVVKIRMQSAAMTTLATSPPLTAAAAPSYSTAAMLREIVRAEGLAGLWKGVGPSMARASALTAAQCATYDESKQLLMKLPVWSAEDSLTTHIGASMLAGMVGTAVSSPMDVVRVRMMAGLNDAAGHAPAYRGSFHCTLVILRTEGLRGLYKGWSANYARLGPQTAITFIMYEYARKLLGMESL